MNFKTQSILIICFMFVLNIRAQISTPENVLQNNNEHSSICHPQSKAHQLKNEEVILQNKTGDLTPPSTPIILNTHLFSWFSAYLEFSPSEDLESGIANYFYAVGSGPGMSDFKNWSALSRNERKTSSVSLWTLGIQANQTFYITMYAKNGDGLVSQTISSAPLAFTWQDLGNSSNVLNFEFGTYGLTATGDITTTFSTDEIGNYTHFMQRMIPIIKEVYGPASHLYTVKIVRDLYYNASNIFFPGSNEIHIGTQFDPLLLTHELIHAFRDDVILSVDAYWRYAVQLSAFEECFAEGLANTCMNRYIELYPNDLIVNPNGDKIYNPIYEASYDMLNRSHLTTQDFWSDGNGMLLAYERYQMAATALLKMEVEHDQFSKLFNTTYYSLLNSNHQHVNTRESIVNLISDVVDEVEGKPVTQWINDQRIFDCTILPGKKIYLWTDYYPAWFVNLIFQRIYFSETFSNGSEWYNAGQYHHLNGATGSYKLYNYAQLPVYTGSFTTSPAGQPFSGVNEYNGFAAKHLALSTNETANPWPGGDNSDFLFNINDLELYNFQVTIDTITENYPRVIGDALINHRGIYGGVLNNKGGNIAFRHESSSGFDTINIQNGTFKGTNTWSSIFNQNYGRGFSVPGKVEVRYRDSLCELYQNKRNIIYGDRNNGVEVFLFDTEKMTHLPFNADFTASSDNNLANFDELTSDAEYWNWDFGDGTTATGQNPQHLYADNGEYNVCMTAGRFENCKAKICKLLSIGLNQIHEKELNLKLLPNPTNGQQTILMNLPFKEAIITIFNIEGKELEEKTFLSHDALNVDLTKYVCGIYILKIEIDNVVLQMRTIKQ
ncbi:MAG: PKD domain-containing protein [Bacteroidota bacterium]